MLTAIVGINWGDEGKGRMVDLLSADYDVICRYQGGNNAGHTVINDKGKFILNLLPSGILRDNVVNVMGCGMVIDLEHLYGELETLRSKGIRITPDKLKISDKAFICMPYHKQQDILEEERLGDKKYGSTRRGIAPVYGDKYMKKGIRMMDLLEPETLKDKLANILEWKDIILSGYGQIRLSLESIYEWLIEYGKPLMPYITDTSAYLYKAVQENKNILFEAQLGALRDIDYGIYPYTTSSQTLAAYATTGAGIPGIKLDNVVGVMKAYSTCVGEGPFVAELFGDEAKALREAGAEYGAATGRPRRVGGFDVPASRYGVKVQGADFIALTKLDVLAYMDKIPVCVAYEIDGKRCEEFPVGDRLMRAKPVYEYMEGFKTDISGCRKPEDLPDAARKYIEFIEKAVGCPIRYVSVGPGRDDYIEMR
ncbi:adenylosuccinate synthetase [Herbinix hemicellulosilytica]|uniref:Adenylosuccinate synthetase n=1 Tax=Herbinix hemicellulosilytica TaxID=1564487 RepID=A0A0H5SJ83_HERHM|nr:adenylosuccinate synthase [Herbinix hemicellulosilytica]RBP58032.1 adenylosuccinate synthetase [Herbinix hemicellulosilytica]CRZ35544.1 Adenylosuccinate synthetase [Herbinix hemicellulosilytica]